MVDESVRVIRFPAMNFTFHVKKLALVLHVISRVSLTLHTTALGDGDMLIVPIIIIKNDHNYSQSMALLHYTFIITSYVCNLEGTETDALMCQDQDPQNLQKIFLYLTFRNVMTASNQK